MERLRLGPACAMPARGQLLDGTVAGMACPGLVSYGSLAESSTSAIPAQEQRRRDDAYQDHYPTVSGIGTQH